MWNCSFKADKLSNKINLKKFFFFVVAVVSNSENNWRLWKHSNSIFFLQFQFAVENEIFFFRFNFFFFYSRSFVQHNIVLLCNKRFNQSNDFFFLHWNRFFSILFFAHLSFVNQQKIELTLNSTKRKEKLNRERENRLQNDNNKKLQSEIKQIALHIWVSIHSILDFCISLSIVRVCSDGGVL